MSATPEPPPSPLEEHERRVFELVASGAHPGDIRWDELLRALEPRPQGDYPFPGPPPLDPDEARLSSEELRQLVWAFRPSAPTPALPAPPTEEARAGYVIEGARGAEAARVRPAFAEALAQHAASATLREQFPDLWAVDLALWRALGQPQQSPASLARSWLASPGRRLVQELAVFKRAPTPTPLGASDFSWQGLCSAAGPLPDEPAWNEPGLEPWRELHAAVPGTALSRWRPAFKAKVSDVLRILEGRRGAPVFLRGAALVWLLNRAATEPFYELDGLRRDLRTDLPPALVSAFPEPGAPGFAELRSAARLETVALQNAARLVASSPEHHTLPRTWSLARWLQSCAFRSPFVGGDEEALAARLRVLLPEEPSPTALQRDVLDPSLLRDDGTGLALEDLALVAGVIEHYEPSSEGAHPVLLPTPPPLVHALRRLAQRPLRPLEHEAEELMARIHEGEEAVSHLASPDSPVPVTEPRVSAAREGNALGWKGPHIAPPLAARWLMTLRNIPWLADASTVWEESLKRFEHEPARHVWMAFALYREHEALPEALRQQAATSWRRVRKATGGRLGEEGALALMAIAVLQHLQETEHHELIALAQPSRPDFRHYVLEALALAGERHQLFSIWSEALEALLEMMAAQHLKEEDRVRAALLALRRASALASTRTERAVYLGRLAAALAQPPFNQYVDLRRELRRLGLALPSETGGAS